LGGTSRKSRKRNKRGRGITYLRAPRPDRAKAQLGLGGNQGDERKGKLENPQKHHQEVGET